MVHSHHLPAGQPQFLSATFPSALFPPLIQTLPAPPCLFRLFVLCAHPSLLPTSPTTPGSSKDWFRGIDQWTSITHSVGRDRLTKIHESQSVPVGGNWWRVICASCRLESQPLSLLLTRPSVFCFLLPVLSPQQTSSRTGCSWSTVALSADSTNSNAVALPPSQRKRTRPLYLPLQYTVSRVLVAPLFWSPLH